MSFLRRTRKQALATILDAANSTGAGVTLKVEEFRNIILAFMTDGGGDAALTAKVQGSISAAAPNFGAAQSKTNHWDYISVVDLQNNSAIDGDTGISVATADDYRLLEVNVNALRWINVVITARTEGELTVKAQPFTNQ